MTTAEQCRRSNPEYGFWDYISVGNAIVEIQYEGAVFHSTVYSKCVSFSLLSILITYIV